MNNPSIAVILVNFNNETDTIACVGSLKKITYQNYKIFIVDNGSGEKSVEKLRPLGGGNIELIETGKNLGFSGGNNVAVKRALAENFDYILLLNNDTEVESDFLDELAAVAESGEKIGVVGPKIYFYPDENARLQISNFKLQTNRIWFGGGAFSWFGGGRHLRYDEIDKNTDEEKPEETGYMTGCAFLIKAKVVKEIGLLCEDFFLYYEDTDWSLRAKKAGYKIMYVPSAKIYHKVSRTASALGNPTIHYYHIRNALLLSKRQAPKIILAGIYVWSAAHYLKQIVKLAVLPSKREISKMIMRGIEDFWKGKFGKYEL